MKHYIRYVFVTLALTLALNANVEIQGEDDVRRTRTVEVLESVQPAVAIVYSFTQDGRRRGTGSGSVIDPRGYILTAKHVIADQHLVLLGGRPPLTTSVVGTMPEFDIAILRMQRPAFQRPGSPSYPRSGLPPDYLRIGVDQEIRMGETILNVGSPGGRGIVASRGIVSAVAYTGVNPLSIALQSSTAFDEMIQFDAASNPGNSGGPLVNLLGQQIGLTVGSIHSEEGIHFAIPAGTIRNCIPEILCSELRHRFVTGITVDRQKSSVTITKVAPDSPAFDADLKAGDQIVAIDGRDLRDPIDWAFSKSQWKPGQSVSVQIQRETGVTSVDLLLAKRKPTPGIAVESTDAGLLCRYTTYDSRLPDPLADEVRPSGPHQVMDTVSARPAFVKPEDHYELLIEGLLKIDQPGRYRLGLKSDDGSRLSIHGRPIIDNSGNHSVILRTGWVDLDSGYHPLTIEYYEDQGNQALELLIAKDDQELQPVSAESLFHNTGDQKTSGTTTASD